MPPFLLCWMRRCFLCDQTRCRCSQHKSCLDRQEWKRLIEKREARRITVENNSSRTKTHSRPKGKSLAHPFTHKNTQSKEWAQSVNPHGHRHEHWHKCAPSPFHTHKHNQELHIPDHSHRLGLHRPSCWLSISQPQLCALPSAPPSSATFSHAHPLPHPEHDFS